MDIELAELQKILVRSEGIKDSLNTEFSNMSTELNEICTNVRSSELTAANEGLSKAITDLADKVNTNLPIIIEFLESQVRSYGNTNTSIQEQINSLIEAVDSIQ